MRYLKHNSSGVDRQPRAGYAIPFFLVLAVLTVVSFIIPLRPTQSYSEKRNLAEFPEFSWEALSSGSYFDDITTWFSDTFPGRESWLTVSSAVSELHGYSEITIHGDIPLSGTTVQTPVETTEAPTEIPTQTAEPTEEPVPETMVLQETTPPTTPVEEWGGVDAGEDAEVYLGSTIQVGDTAFTYFGFSEYTSNRFIKLINNFADVMAESDVNIIFAPAPTAVGVMVENEYMEKLGCEPQDEALDYLRAGISDRILTVDTVRNLIPHNDEYLFFRTDHHWTALAAYYTYELVMEALGQEPAPLDSFEEWDQGEFQGSLYYKCNQSSKLRSDNVMAYIPQGDISTMIYDSQGYGFEWTLLTDMTRSNVGSKYMTFIAGDHALTVITNNDLPDAPNCVVIKESFGNCFVPFLTQNYHTVYVVDYREYYKLRMSQFVEQYDIQDVIILPNLGATQSENVCGLLETLLR